MKLFKIQVLYRKDDEEFGDVLDVKANQAHEALLKLIEHEEININDFKDNHEINIVIMRQGELIE